MKGILKLAYKLPVDDRAKSTALVFGVTFAVFLMMFVTPRDDRRGPFNAKSLVSMARRRVRSESLMSKSGMPTYTWPTVSKRSAAGCGADFWRRIMIMRYALLCGTLLLVIWAVDARGWAINDDTLPSNYVPSGGAIFKQYCATCHGSDAMGNGPLAASLKTPPPDLTTLAKRHDGKFPYEYVTDILKFGPGLSAHGSSEMPAWGPIFRYLNKPNDRVVQKRIKNLCDYLASLQQN